MSDENAWAAVADLEERLRRAEAQLRRTEIERDQARSSREIELAVAWQQGWYVGSSETSRASRGEAVRFVANPYGEANAA